MAACFDVQYVSRFSQRVSVGVALAMAALLCGACDSSPKKSAADIGERAEPVSGAESVERAESSSEPSVDGLCKELQAMAAAGPPAAPERITLKPVADEKTILLSKTGVFARFSREDFLATARCLNLQQALEYAETQTGDTAESPLRDAFQLSYVAAALLDVGRVGIRVRGESAPRSSIVRDGWSAVGCAGQCRSVGRVYRLSESDPSFFFRVTDKTDNIED